MLGGAVFALRPERARPRGGGTRFSSARSTPPRRGLGFFCEKVAIFKLKVGDRVLAWYKFLKDLHSFPNQTHSAGCWLTKKLQT